jgi:tetratricopeptide (TPR) repeat protein
MAISAHARKILWTRAADRCAICRRPLTRDPVVPGDAVTLLGEECHIVAQAGGGPRGGEIPDSELDRYENLILLCGADHTLIDRQTHLYTSAHLRDVRAEHEAWVQQRLGEGPPRSMSDDATPRRGVSNAPRKRLGFTGREAEIDAIANFVREGTPVAIHGLGGIGKTRLVAEYSFRASAEYDLVWWVRADNEVVLTTDLAQLAQILELVPTGTRDVDEALSSVYAWLAAHDRWLLVFDNVEDPGQISNHVLSRKGGAVLITSRFGGGWQGVAHPLALGVWSRKESLAFLEARAFGSGRGGDPAQQEQLAERLGDLPLALEQAAAYIAATQITVSDYLQRLAAYSPRLLGEGKPVDYRETVATTWALSFNEVAQDPPAELVLLVSAFCGPDRIPRWLFDSSSALGELVPDMADALTVDGAIARLMTFSLIDAEPGWLTMHRLVQEVARDDLERTQAVSYYSLTEQLLLRSFPGESRNAEGILRARALVPHVIAAAAHSSELDLETDATAALLTSAGAFLCWQLELVAAAELLESARRIQAAVSGDARLSVAIHIELARVLSEQGDFDSAGREARHAIELFSKQIKKPPSALPMLISELSLVQRRAGRLPEAAATAREALRLAERLGQDDPPVLISPLVSLANALEDREEALKHLRRALAIAEASATADEHTVAVIWSNMANRRGGAGDIQQGVVDAEESLAAAETAYGPDHPRIADMLINAANVFRDSGRLEDAREAARRAVHIEEKAHADDRRRALSLMTLAQIEQRLGEHDAANTTIDRAYEAATTTAGASAVAVQVLSVRGDIRREADDVDGADADLTQALEQALATPGVDHHTLGMTCTRLGSVRRMQGLPSEAVELHQQATALLGAGDSHPAALMDALNNLGNALSECGDIPKAVRALERARAIGVQGFGPQHQRTWQVAVNLAHAYVYAGDMCAAKVVIAEAQGVQPHEIEITPIEP